MSQHEIEDLVERSVRVVDRQVEDARLARDVIVNLYRLQGQFDCGYTHGRVHELLVRRRALLPRPLLRHPDAERFAALFARAKGREGWLTPGTASDGAAGMEASLDQREELWSMDATSVADRPKGLKLAHEDSVFLRGEDLLVDAGSSLWKRMAARGDFSGLDAEEPERLSPARVARLVVEAAAAAGDRELMSWWYAVLPGVVLVLGEPEDAGALSDDADVARILELVERTRAFELRSDWGLLKPPREEELADQPETFLAFARRWFALQWALPPQRDRTKVVLGICRELAAAVEAGEPPGTALKRAADDLAEFRDWSSFLALFQYGLGHSLGQVAPLIKSVVDFSGPEPVVDEAKANATLRAKP